MTVFGRVGFASLMLGLAAGGCGGEVQPSDGSVPDATIGDSGLDATISRCEVDSECDDGLYCSGSARCSPESAGADTRGCVAGASPCPSDGERCDEDLDACVSCDADGDTQQAEECGGDDCDDDDPNRFVGNAEVCDGTLDEDCDPTTFGSRDADGDGRIDAACCNEVDGATRCGDDCDDSRGDVHPFVPEVCNGRDDDCDGMTDEDVLVDLFSDADGDGHGDPAAPSSGCPGAPGLVASADDCDDADAGRHPGAAEICNGADEDCDRTPDNGAEASCSLPSAIAGCDAGSCVVVSCNANRGNCDADSSNGCETDTTSSMAHCGGCGSACELASASETCTGSTCVITACDPGYGNCDGLTSSGCELSLRTLSDCGTCGTACSLPNASATCVTGTCEVVSCTSGFGDCGTGAGCETSVRTNSNCGSCGATCPPSGPSWHATTTCGTGTCQISDCDTGYCDNSPSVAGCETDIDTDPACPMSMPMVHLDVSGDTGTGTSVDTYGPFIGERWFAARIRENNVSIASSGREDLRVTFTINQGPAPVDVIYTGNVYCVNCGSTPRYFSHLNSLTITFTDTHFAGVGDPDNTRIVWIEVEMATSLRTGCGGWTVQAVGDPTTDGSTTATCG